MTPDDKRWAEALEIERMCGDRAPLGIVERIGALTLSGDAAGVQGFKRSQRSSSCCCWQGSGSDSRHVEGVELYDKEDAAFAVRDFQSPMLALKMWAPASLTAAPKKSAA